MALLIVGLLLFLGAHSVRIVADPWRSAQVARFGEKPWKGLISLLSLIGFVLIVWGYVRARAAAGVVWIAPDWTRYLAALAFILVVASYLPANRIKARVGHPMVLGVMAWALGHLLANGTPAAALLFGAFLVWAVADYATARRRDRAAAVGYPAGAPVRDAVTVAVGLAAWTLFAFVLHGWLIGVRPFG